MNSIPHRIFPLAATWQHCMPHYSGVAVKQGAAKLGQDHIHFSCVWFVSVVALRAAICPGPTVPSNQLPSQPQLFHTLYINATLLPIN